MRLRTILAPAIAGMLLLFPAAPMRAATTKCATAQPCSTFTNTSSGPGIEAVGTSGEAGIGVSSGGAGFIGLSGSGTFLDAGIDGESYNASGNDAGGVFGADYFVNGTAPTYGAVGVGAPYGLLGLGIPTSSNGTAYGVLGQDDYGSASLSGDYNVGVGGQSVAGTGMLGTSNGGPVVSVFGEAPVGVYGVADTATTANPNAFAFFGETNSFGLDIHQTASGATAFVISPSYLFYASTPSGYFYVDNSGNGHFSGTVTTSKGTYVVTRGASGAAMTEYAQRTTAPEVDDTGEAQLVNGSAYVHIDPRLADTIDSRTAYLVFVTPEGECNQLYVTGKSPAGFAVRESHGGRSTLAFDYRIVAKPINDNGTRLPFASTVATRPLDGVVAGRARNAVAPRLSPLDRLKQQIGGQRFAQAMANFRAQRQPLIK